MFVKNYTSNMQILIWLLV